MEGLIEVTEEEIELALFDLLEKEHLVCEGAGAMSYAAVLSGKVEITDNSVVILSGGNIDLTTLGRVIERVLVKSKRVSAITVLLEDKPGNLAKALNIIAAEGGNIIDISHHRYLPKGKFWEVEVKVIIEVNNNQQLEDIITSLKEEGINVIHN